MTTELETSFADLGLSAPILSALTALGYEKPSPIQLECIPHLLNGRDVLGMAQTGSGKTAAFGLPLLHNIDPELKAPQVLVLAPTRELAIQVAEALTSFSKDIKGVNVVALYGGQRYDVQLRALRQGPQVVVGTPGRLLDHLKRGTLNLSNLKGLVLDEADEMLRMGFIEDVENILAQIPAEHQTALFSATMPEAIRRITRRFMKEPQEVRIQSSVTTRPDISQVYWKVGGGYRKNEALVRFLEAEDFDAAIIFVRTKNATLEVAEALERSGYSSAALNGDMNQALREQTLERLKDGRLDILIATDVAARGLDVERISLVVNYDIPMDSESYVHRIGRTGRAGRAGRALLFVENRERRLLQNIERTMKLTIPEVELPNAQLLSERRLAKFAAKVSQQLESSDLDMYRALLAKLQPEEEFDIETLAAALLKMAQGERPLILPPEAPRRPQREFNSRDDRGSDRGRDRDRGDSRRDSRPDSRDGGERPARRERRDVGEMELYRIEVGRDDGVEVRHIVGAIANEGDISSRYIGNIKLFASHSTIELPKGMPGEMLSHFTRTRILNKPLNMQLLGDAQPHERRERPAGGNGGERRGGGRSFGGERRDGAGAPPRRSFGSDRAPAAGGERRPPRDAQRSSAPRRDDAAAPAAPAPARRRFGDA
ncbi:ATP-dependent RNA helicase DeaD [Yersinia frederiksenii]|uniref:ATP-dependent RNA helicase DeaD n=1 Tax=Yersinia alsatica TaxID=2890317 RepID=A0ABY5UQG0_9GAMM|nr:DEAD/DEAH family ATP-dependent RNA helicase [Yersinia alsatica]OWF67343.1 DEAD/DEAH family ATP-dependent RNA helicase [Yersinia frederiksenii]UWM45711.1 DEAD/DEAH family ATP-dependent RNA helicase [Yersinia alsatica]CNI44685.1 ATP-dependent RNA helicase DeaD [Yersinia frederiksenii]CNL17421.1 ATP-dependent RNA helicase DeaD [Yersinia frederiksenii]CNL40403.1 ATP-dependent RNA helicase DeaD [Yersinia frederiksenii]